MDLSILDLDKKVIPLDTWADQAVDWLVLNYREVFQLIKWPVERTLEGLNAGLSSLHPLIVIAIIGVIAWRAAGYKLSLFTIITFIVVGLLGMWEDTMTTLAMVLCAVVFCTIIGIPLGIFAGRNDTFESCLRPILDAMQTTPPFVYLVPVVMLFSVGTVAGVLATIIFALPPIIRLTSLGIRQVHPELVEAALAFGATKSQVLYKVQLPLARTTIMAGLNQTIMMSLSMVVIAALIGAGGLGMPVVRGLNNMDIGLAVIAGISIVLMAMVLDRVTQGLGKKQD